MFPAMSDLGNDPLIMNGKLAHCDAVLRVWGESDPISVGEPNKRDVAFCEVVPAKEVESHPALIQPIIAAFRVKTDHAAFQRVKDLQWKDDPAWDSHTWVSLIQKVHDDPKLDGDLLRAKDLLSHFKISWPRGIQEIRGLQRVGICSVRL